MSIKTGVLIVIILTLVLIPSVQLLEFKREETELLFTPLKPLTYSEIIDDLRSLQAALTDAHPNLYFIRTEDEVDAFFKSQAADVSFAGTSGDVQRRVAQIVSYLGGDHMGITPLGNDAYILPINIIRFKGRYFIGDSKDKNILQGDEVIEINGQPMDLIWARLAKYSPKPYGRAVPFYIETHFTELFSLAFPNHHVEIKIRRKRELLNYTVNQNGFDLFSQLTDLEQADISIQNHFLAPVLTIKSISAASATHIKSIISQLKNNKRLIIDLRNNSGGLNRNSYNLCTLFKPETRNQKPVKTAVR